MKITFNLYRFQKSHLKLKICNNNNYFNIWENEVTIIIYSDNLNDYYCRLPKLTHRNK